MSGSVLITRPSIDSKPVIDAVRALGLTPLVEPMIEIEFLLFNLPLLNDYDALVFSSVNAVRAVADRILDKSSRVYVVGPQTEEAVRAAGWRDVIQGAGGVAGLRHVIKAADVDALSLLYLSAENISEPLEVPGYRIDRIPVYRASQTKVFSPAGLEAFDGRQVSMALFFSARTAETFMRLLKETRRTDCFSQTKVLCISDSVVKSLRDIPWRSVHVAHTPDRACMLRMLSELAADASA